MYLQRTIRKKIRKKITFCRCLEVHSQKSGIRGRIRYSEVRIQIRHGSRTLLFFSFYPSLVFPLFSNAMHPTLVEMLLK
jgi:hypothetical protein